MKYFLDTNIIIYALKDSYPSIKHHFESTPSTSIVIPSVVLAEIEYSARKSIDYEKTIIRYNAFTRIFEEVPFSDKAVTTYGTIRSTLEKQGLIIGGNDMLIAAYVLAEGGILVTHNTKEFSRIPGLIIEDWTR